MKTLEKAFTSVLSLLLIGLFLPTEHKSQTKPPGSKTRQGTSPAPKDDSSNWQAIVLTDKGIKFKLPPDWRRYEKEIKSETEISIGESFEWYTPDTETIKVVIYTYKKAFMSSTDSVVSKEGMLKEKFDRFAEIKKSDPQYREVKKLKLSEVEGFIRVLQMDPKDNTERKLMIWAGYRIFQGKAQEVQLVISVNPKTEKLLQSVFNTLEIEQD